MGVSSKIKQIRQEKNFSQEYMATQMGISQSYYAKMEKGLVDFKISQLSKISKIINIKIIQLLEESN